MANINELTKTTISQPTNTDLVSNLADKIFATSPLIFPLLAIVFLFFPCFVFCLCYARGFNNQQLPPKTPKTPQQIA